VRLVAISTPRPIKTMTPTMIHMDGTFNRYAAIANPMTRMMKPSRYVANEDIGLSPG
jgi:hypothetical protein